MGISDLIQIITYSQRGCFKTKDITVSNDITFFLTWYTNDSQISRLNVSAHILQKYSCHFRYLQAGNGENSDEENEVDYNGTNHERVSRDGIVLSPPRIIRRLQDYTDYSDNNANPSSSEGLADSVGGLHQRREDHSGRIYTSNLAHIHDRYSFISPYWYGFKYLVTV